MSGLSRTLRQLDEALDLIGDHTMTISEFDGFVAGILVCPEVIAPAAWLSRVWSGDPNAEGDDDDEPVFDDSAHLQRTTGLILGHYNTVADVLLRRRNRYSPILDIHDPTDEIFWEFWIGGFMTAMRLRPDAWTPVLEAGDEAGDALTALLMLDAVGRKDAGLPEDMPSAAELQSTAPDMIAVAIAMLAAHRTSPVAGDLVPQRGKTGRNEPCPCGSGKKYKKCCGVA